MPKVSTIKLDENKHIHCSCDVLAVNIGYSAVGVRKFCKANEIPITRGKIDVAEYFKVRQVKQIDDTNNMSDSARKLKAEADLKTSKARQEEMITLQMMGELIPYEEVSDALKNTFLDIRQKLLALPEIIKSKVYAQDPAIAIDVAEEVEKQVGELLTRLTSDNISESQKNVGKKPKRHYKKRKTSVSTTATGNGE